MLVSVNRPFTYVCANIVFMYHLTLLRYTLRFNGYLELHSMVQDRESYTIIEICKNKCFLGLTKLKCSKHNYFFTKKKLTIYSNRKITSGAMAILTLR